MPGITASRNYYPGDLIYSEESFVQVLPKDLKDILCEWCGERTLFLKACKQCSAVKYCGKGCQKNDWGTHRLECKRLKNLRESASENEDTVRLFGKLILKMKGKDWKIVKSRVLGTDFSFNDIDSHYKEMTEKPQLNLFYKELKEQISNFIGKENMPGDVDLIKMIGKVRHIKTLCIDSLNFYIGMNIFNLECIPNANFEICGRTAKVWAIKRINKGIDKISISSNNILSRKLNFLTDGEDDPKCKCTDCSLPYGESILTKIVDEKRAYSVIKKSQILLNLTSIPGHSFEGDIRPAIDKLLKEQEGVLGKTNSLRIKLLALKCLGIGGNPLLVMKDLMELEKRMRFVFGELYLEMLPIYHTLIFVHCQIGNYEEAIRYKHRVNRLLMHRTE